MVDRQNPAPVGVVPTPQLTPSSPRQLVYYVVHQQYHPVITCELLVQKKLQTLSLSHELTGHQGFP